MLLNLKKIQLVNLQKSWDESKHPRDEKGRFGRGSGGGKKSEKPKRERMSREEYQKWHESEVEAGRRMPRDEYRKKREAERAERKANSTKGSGKGESQEKTRKTKPAGTKAGKRTSGASSRKPARATSGARNDRQANSKGNEAVQSNVKAPKSVNVHGKKVKVVGYTPPAGENRNAFYQITDQDAFHKAITEAKNNNPNGAFVYAYDKDEYKDMKMFVTDNGEYGFAVKSDGDIVSVFGNPNIKSGNKNFVQDMLPLAIEHGGKKMDCFGHADTDKIGFLPGLYSQAGFHPVAKLKFNDDYSPEGWNYEKFGRPDVVFMAHNGDSHAKVVKTLQKGGYKIPEDSMKHVPFVDDYDQAGELQKQFLENPKSTGRKPKKERMSREEYQKWHESEVEAGRRMPRDEYRKKREAERAERQAQRAERKPKTPAKAPKKVAEKKTPAKAPKKVAEKKTPAKAPTKTKKVDSDTAFVNQWVSDYEQSKKNEPTASQKRALAKKYNKLMRSTGLKKSQSGMDMQERKAKKRKQHMDAMKSLLRLCEQKLSQEHITFTDITRINNIQREAKRRLIKALHSK